MVCTDREKDMQRLISGHHSSSLASRLQMLLSCWPLKSPLCAGGKMPFKRGAQYTMQKKNGPSPSKGSTGLRDASVLLPTRRTWHIRKDLYCYQIYFHPEDVGTEEPKLKQTFHRTKSKLKWMPSSVTTHMPQSFMETEDWDLSPNTPQSAAASSTEACALTHGPRVLRYLARPLWLSEETNTLETQVSHWKTDQENFTHKVEGLLKRPKT